MAKYYKKILISLTLLVCQSALALNNADSALFGYTQYEKSNLNLFPQWLNVLERHIKQMSQSRSCEAQQLNQCDLERWLAFLLELRDLPEDEQLRRVNQFANEKAYILDLENYGVADYWATPGEFLLANGDCEDYVIIKLLSMKWLGYDVARMRVVIVQDTNLRTPHAVMAIEQNSDILILDNQIPEILSHTAIYHYVPVYSVNDKHWWMHVPN